MGGIYDFGAKALRPIDLHPRPAKYLEYLSSCWLPDFVYVQRCLLLGGLECKGFGCWRFDIWVQGVKRDFQKLGAPKGTLPNFWTTSELLGVSCWNEHSYTPWQLAETTFRGQFHAVPRLCGTLMLLRVEGPVHLKVPRAIG